MQFRCYSSKL